MNKKLIISWIIPVLIALLHVSPGYAQKIITVRGKVQFLNPEDTKRFNKVWYGVRQGFDYNMIDSTEIKPDGTWQLTIKAETPKFYEVDIAKWARKTIWTDKDLELNTRGYDTSRVKIKNPSFIFTEGSADNNFVNLVDHVNHLTYQRMIALNQVQYNASKSNDTAWINYFNRDEPFKKMYAENTERLKILIRAYKDNPVVLYGIRSLNYEREQPFIQEVLDNLIAVNPGYTDAVDFRNAAEESIRLKNKLKPGNPVPYFSYNDPNGNPVPIDSFRGKYVLIDFWASWCGPCLKAIPNLKELYGKYHDQGFEILSVSIDDKPENWRKSMQKENMPWKHVLSPDNNKTMTLFDFAGIPTFYLIDKEGNIVKRFSGYSDKFVEEFEKVFNK